MRMELHDKGLVLSAPEIPGGPIFSVLPEKIGEKRDTGVRFGACCGCDFREILISSCYEHTDSPYECYGTRRLLRYNGFANSCV